MNKHTPWSQEDAEKWAHNAVPDKLRVLSDDKCMIFRQAFLAGMAKAAEMIEACETVNQDEECRLVRCKYPDDFETKMNELLSAGGWRVVKTEMSETDHQYIAMLIRTKLVGVRPIAEGKRNNE